ncbi:Metallo-dependent hydrolase [Acrodontium crateriforme]|uniref:Metallo-dependent hydrolase n=1 Tax=Acrodontium crateriforme TaxID=150365 RepID=A0AAQ3R6Y8_9PEZI|nr:Metallo-dependent hydrolase [Acrodontium crateriforme]
MAGDFLRSHGIDIDAEMARIQNETPSSQHLEPKETLISNVYLPQTAPGSIWDVQIRNGKIDSISPCTTRPSIIPGKASLLTPSLCHPHIHLDKAFLLPHPRYSHLQIENGDFAEAMSLTGQAKANFEHEDLVERGERLVEESVAAGVTHMRAFVEVDAGVDMKCLTAGLQLQNSWRGKCTIQLCAFAQLPLFSSSPGDGDGSIIRKLMETAAVKVEVVGSTPYVETDGEKMERNVDYMIDLSIEKNLHLDFHLDYNIDRTTEPLVWYVVRTLKQKSWVARTTDRTVVFGHCTRLTLFTPDEWKKLKDEIGDLPISFVGLPTSDLFMMRCENRSRATLDVPNLIKDYDINACLGINNVGNAFTPQGSCDPLTLACNGVGIYQSGTRQDVELLFECISTRARQAIGFGRHGQSEARVDLQQNVGDQAHVLLFGSEKLEWRTRRSVSEAVYLYDHCRGRKGYLNGVATS